MGTSHFLPRCKSHPLFYAVPIFTTIFLILFHGSSLIFNVDTAHLRIGLRVYLTGLFFMLSFVGNQCCSNRVKLRLMREHPISVNLMTGWLDGYSALKAWVAQRRPPGGWLAIAMILAWAISFTGDLMVTGLVKTIDIVGRCEFDVGVICNPPDDNSYSWVFPSRDNTAVTIVMQAQNTSRANGGQVGIYQKADTDPNFRADDDDVLGYWNCSFVQNTTFPADFDKGAYEGVIASLQQSGLLYNTSVDFTYEAMPAGNKTFTAWSPSALNRPNDLVRKVWDVKVCREVSQNGTFAPIPIMCFYCNMNAPYAEWIVELMEAGETLSQFTGALFGAISDANDTNIDGILASMLEAITMVGSEPRIPFNKAPVGKGILETTQGCLAARAEIPWPVFLILVVP